MMIGYHAVPVIVDAYLKGIGDFDAEKALKACVATANLDNYRGIGLYKKLGYIPYNIKDEYNADNWSLSKTLEYAFDDYALQRWRARWERRNWRKSFTSVLKTTRMYSIPLQGLCSPLMTRVFLSGLSVPMTIQPYLRE